MVEPIMHTCVYDLSDVGLTSKMSIHQDPEKPLHQFWFPILATFIEPAIILRSASGA